MVAGKPPLVSAGLALLAAWLGGCVAQPAKPVARPAPPAPALPDGQSPSADVAVNDDPCAIQLHDIEGGLLQYYMLNQRLPGKLAEIQNLGDVLSGPIVLTCPTTHQPYIYNPTGLVCPTSRNRIIVYESTAAHHGGRFCLWVEPQASGKGLVMDVGLLTEKEFKKYVPPLQP